jgi:hypothetical protein
MPFTFSHPAIVVHLSNTKLGLSLTGLIIGSMVPDFEFFMRMRIAENIGHHWLGLFVFDLPLALLLCFLFHNLVRNLLVTHLPHFYAQRFVGYTSFNWNQYVATNKLKVIVSISIGILSHLFWDAFTHHDGIIVLLLPTLSKNIQAFGFTTPVYMLLQIISSIWGLWALYSYIKKLPISTATWVYAKETNFYWAIFTPITLLIFMLRLILLPQYLTFWDLFMASMGSIFYALIITSVVYTKKEWLSSGRNNSSSNKFI